jgi:protocatechuate 3,4-dioxygenase beta subunit
LPGNDGEGTGGQSLEVAEGAKIENIALEIKRGGVITGRITDSRGDPAPDEEVFIHRFDKEGKLQRIYFSLSGPGETRADDRGVYRIYGLPEGRYLVSGGHEYDSLIGQFRPRIFYPNVTIESKAKVIEVSEGSEATGIDVTLPNPGQRSIKRERTGEITARLVTEDGVGLPNVKVNMQPVTEDGRSILSGGVLDITDEDGNMRFPQGIGPKNEPSFYWIRVSNAKGYAPKRSVNQRIGDDITITMIKGGVITGRVTNAKGEPVLGASVAIEMARDAEGKPSRGSIELPYRSTDDRGVYRFYGLTPGTYVVFTQSNIACPFARPNYSPSSSTREMATEVTVTSGGETSGVDIRYRENRGRIE